MPTYDFSETPEDKESFKKIKKGLEKLKKDIADDNSPVLQNVPKFDSNKNIYQVAREKAFARFPVWRQKEILTMEANKDTDNRFYEEFVTAVVEESGDVASLAMRNRAKGV